MNDSPLKILLADDDEDDCFFFREVLKEIPFHSTLTIAQDGVELMELLNAMRYDFDVLFLDLNMPRKNGYECLTEIKRNHFLKELTVIIYTTSQEKYLLKQLELNGANHFIRKPSEFSVLKETIYKSLMMLEKRHQIVSEVNFILS